MGRCIWSLFGVGLLLTTTVEAFFVSVDEVVVAGEPALVQISDLLAGEKVALELENPEQNKIRFELQADQNGVVQDEIYGLHLQKSGAYNLEIVRTNLDDQKEMNLVVMPGTVSTYHSSVEVLDPSIPADGETESNLKITLRDAYANALYDQPLRVLSSRLGDEIRVHSANSNGVVDVMVQSREPGVSFMTVLAGEQVLAVRPEIVFYLDVADNVPEIGAEGNLSQYLQAQLFGEQLGDVAYFAIEDFPNEVVVDKNQSAKIVAKDIDGKTVRDYTGTVRFSSTDSRVLLPDDYTFKTTDQGEHVFSLAYTFGTVGDQTLSVYDLDDIRIAGERRVRVVRNLGEQPNVQQPMIEIVSPTASSARSARVTISGRASGVKTVNIIDGPTLLVAGLAVDEAGGFVFQTPALANGKHVFQVLSTEDPSVVSAEVPVTIDRVPPTVMAVEMSPENPRQPGSEYRLAITTTEPLSSARCVVDEVGQDLEPDSGRYEGVFQAPLECGEYAVVCTVSDLLGNELTEPRAAMVQVCGEEISDKVPAKLDAVEDVSVPIVPPSSVFNLSAEGGNEMVTLYWSPANDDTGVASYEIFYGTDPNDLELSQKTPDNRTQWYVDGLGQATKYFFQVQATDLDGQVGPMSPPVQASTNGDLQPAAPKLDETGAEDIWWFLPLGFLLGGLGLFFWGARRG